MNIDTLFILLYVKNIYYLFGQLWADKDLLWQMRTSKSFEAREGVLLTKMCRNCEILIIFRPQTNLRYVSHKKKIRDGSKNGVKQYMDFDFI